MELAIVMPARNEEGCIRQTLDEWLNVLSSSGLTSEKAVQVIVIDDGSTDRTTAILAELAAADPRIRFVRQTGIGHGPSVVNGYRLALDSGAEHIFQVDSDNEFDPYEFPKIWQHRDRAPFVFGCRVRRSTPPSRRFISLSLRLLLKFLFRVRIPDSNVPYRLMNRYYLGFAVENIPPGVFIPNVCIAILAHILQVPVIHVPITHRKRTTGKVSIVSWRLVRACLQCLGQLLAWRLRFRRIRYIFAAHGAYVSGQVPCAHQRPLDVTV
ncbi:glycosyltransferase family 2 protein [Streptomyces sp. NBRC 110028]|uniref:glycosyltransferase family 2 protein n=1 Tax=Streptomyces sp. NBRC 110028 TaxID=1621260 RepID=UPI0006E1FE4E|nr:glycosyltransferase family 2 protein [Streptomyces sp. NBRC 110028]